MAKKNFKGGGLEGLLSPSAHQVDPDGKTAGVIGIHAKVSEELKVRLDVYCAKERTKKGEAIEQAISGFLREKGY